MGELVQVSVRVASAMPIIATTLAVKYTALELAHLQITRQPQPVR